MAYNPLQILETSLFTRQVLELLSAEEYRLLQMTLIMRPDAGAVIPGSGGLRKLRWALPGRGKRGGARVIYFWRTREQQILLLYIYQKNLQATLTPAQLKALRQVAAED
ncbi:MAG: type II toxin-antitoxin system RelE/ParE family toxin [Gemmatimonadaceae bacterium]